MTPRRLVISALVVVVAASCSNGDDEPAAPPATAAAPATPAEPPAVGPPTTAGPTAPATTEPATTGPPVTAAPSTAPPTSEGTTTVAVTAPPGPPAVSVSLAATLELPVDLAWRQGDDRLYVAQQSGEIFQVDAVGGGAPRLVLDLGDLTEAAGEQGLLGLAFSPDGTVAYVNYTDLNGDTVIAEHPVDEAGLFGTGDLARTVLLIDQPFANHNGGDLTFGPDGYLYIGTGDGGSAGDPDRRASDPADLLGKLLRIDPAIAAGQPYTSPADNPFVQSGGAPEVWAIGLRNPWRFSFDRDTGDLWIADVGQNAIEEIDAVVAEEGADAGRGANFGWSAFEGDQPFNDDVEAPDAVVPVYTYTQDEGCAVAGGVRARGEGAGSLEGWYVFGDNCAGQVWALPIERDGDTFVAGERVTLGEVPRISAVVDGPDGTIYVLSLDGGVYRLTA